MRPVCLVLAIGACLAPGALAADPAPPATIPEAKSVDLDQPVSAEALMESASTQRAANTTPPDVQTEAHYHSGPLENEIIYPQSLPEMSAANPLLLLGAKVPPGTATRLAWSPSQSFEGIAVPTPVLVVNGAQDGPTLCLTAAIHGDELNGIEIVRRVLYNLDAQALSGAVIGVPIVNLQGFRRGSRYLTDRRDLNRHFPGNPGGSSAARIAHSFFNDVVTHCDALVDLHTGSFHRTNLPQLRANLKDPAILSMTHGFGSTVVMHSEGSPGTLRRAAAEHGIPTVTVEAGAPMRLEEDSVNQGVMGIETLLGHMKMMKRFRFWGNPEPVYYESSWVRADQGGILLNSVELGQTVSFGELLGTVTDPITNMRVDIRAPHAGRILGMALNQVVLPGFAAYRIGTQTTKKPDELEDNEHLSADDDVAEQDVDVSEDDALAE
ncbi:succinylglutamate desuccinylase/aspartoacylase family protein [Pseudohalioglobus lutimaris]|uniref:Succinylglutamate desuccinylase n=1 Tax=Pseudohalioglobus lutimaris TaxID=1737061 RepID=A0A2N5X568_9GAMM|nr:succinylglutamate desuccinylase/aspartoacylase family protein [Pseudohalioglobus lutimaris]PLW69627.1 succinylglutamate desuccinylase [Pseudohalioglobus lutimaris]